MHRVEDGDDEEEGGDGEEAVGDGYYLSLIDHLSILLSLNFMQFKYI